MTPAPELRERVKNAIADAFGTHVEYRVSTVFSDAADAAIAACGLVWKDGLPETEGWFWMEDFEGNRFIRDIVLYSCGLLDNESGEPLPGIWWSAGGCRHAGPIAMPPGPRRYGHWDMTINDRGEILKTEPVPHPEPQEDGND